MSRDEFRRVKREAWRILRAGVDRVRKNTHMLTAALEESPVATNKSTRLRDQILVTIAEHGRLPESAPDDKLLEGLFGNADLRFLFCLTALETYAGMVLLCAFRGYNASTLYDLKATHQRPDGGVGSVQLVNVVTQKARRGPSKAISRDTLVNSGGLSAAAVYELLREVTQHARTVRTKQGMSTDSLFMARSKRTQIRSEPQFLLGPSIPHVAKQNGWSVVDDHGQPLEVSLQRIRLTEQVLNRKPRLNSQNTHDSIYVIPDRSIDAEAAQTIRDGQADAIQHARSLFRLRALSTSERSLAETNPDALASTLGVSRGRLSLLLAGQLDTPIAACLDFQHSPFSDGGECRASFLNCLGCQNALAAPEHLPRLICLHDALTNVASAVTPEIWKTDYHTHFVRLDTLLSEAYTESERSAARAKVTDAVRSGIEQMLRRRRDA
jgi:hypothetical protein